MKRYVKCSRTSLIRTPKGQSEVSVLEGCPYKRGHYDDVTFMTPLTVFNRGLVANYKTRLTLVFKLHLKLLIHKIKTLSFCGIQHCTSQLQTNYCFKTIRATAPWYSAMMHVKLCNVKHNFESVFRYFASAVNNN